MTSVTALEAKTRFGKLLARVARGEEIVITRHDRPVARLVPQNKTSLQALQETVADIYKQRDGIARRRTASPKLSPADIKSAVEEGRR